MPTISSCPFCQVKVAAPPGAAPADEVRCPLCQAQFSLEETLDIALPELIVVRSSGVLTSPPELVASSTTANGDAWRSGTSFGMPVYRPSDVAGFDMSAEAADIHAESATDAAAGSTAPPSQVSGGFHAENGGSNLHLSWDQENATATDEDSIQPSGTELDTGVELFNPAETGIVARPREKQKQANMAVEMVKTMLGGLIGLFVAYMILMWSLKNWDPLQFGHKLPAFMVPENLEGPR